jgi:hypothetical protein
MNEPMTFIKPLVAALLRDGERRDWTVQGFGFLRTYFGPLGELKRFRLNLWHSKFTVSNVSTIHNHPWDFKSVIIAGSFINQRFICRTGPPYTHTHAIIKTGITSKAEITEMQHCRLISCLAESYASGDTYEQFCNEIHETKFSDGAITLNERIGDTEHARIFWPYGTEWIDAKPRRATPHEIAFGITEALKVLDTQ